jgi:hypothetical protein
MENKSKNKKTLILVAETQFKKLSATILEKVKSNLNHTIEGISINSLRKHILI